MNHPLHPLPTHRRPRLGAVAGLALGALLGVAAALPAAAESAAIDTHFALLAGHGGDGGDGASGAVVVPGTVIPLAAGPLGLVGDQEYSQRIAGLAGKLRRTLRLGEVRVLYTYPTRSVVGEEAELPPPTATSPIRVTTKLRGYNDQLATYEVRFHDGSKLFADSVVSVERGKQAVVGGLDGDEAPYLFLVVSPAAGGAAGPRRVEGDVTPPRRLHGAAPAYTEEARKERTQGVVIMRAHIGADGTVRDVEVLKGLPHGLNEAAAEAIRGWSFEPARDADGQPIDVYYNLTVNFVLAKEGEAKPRSEG